MKNCFLILSCLKIHIILVLDRLRCTGNLSSYIKFGRIELDQVVTRQAGESGKLKIHKKISTFSVSKCGTPKLYLREVTTV